MAKWSTPVLVGYRVYTTWCWEIIIRTPFLWATVTQYKPEWKSVRPCLSFEPCYASHYQECSARHGHYDHEPIEMDVQKHTQTIVSGWAGPKCSMTVVWLWPFCDCSSSLQCPLTILVYKHVYIQEYLEMVELCGCFSNWGTVKNHYLGMIRGSPILRNTYIITVP